MSRLTLAHNSLLLLRAPCSPEASRLSESQSSDSASLRCGVLSPTAAPPELSGPPQCTSLRDSAYPVLRLRANPQLCRVPPAAHDFPAKVLPTGEGPGAPHSLERGSCAYPLIRIFIR